MKICPKCRHKFEDSNTVCPRDGTALEKADDSLIGQILADKYRLDERISQGGMGAVYRATHVLMEKVVAVKVLHPSLAADEKVVARFSREARAASRIHHPHAISVTDFGEAEGGPVFLVMEYLRGQTLKEIIRKDGPLSLRRAVEILRQISGALEAAHAEGVVHRDLKSDNIVIEQMAGGGDWVKVLDFGIAKIKEAEGEQDPGLTAPNLIISTPQYMSPEQCSQTAQLDSRSDIYSLGVILYEMLAGHVPFGGSSPTEIMLKHLQEPPPSILEERNDLSPAIDQVVAKALAKRPEDRFQQAIEMSDSFTLVAQAIETSEHAPSSPTNRIVVSTIDDQAPPDLPAEDDDATLVRPGVSEERPVESAGNAGVPPAHTFNPWRIAIPAFILLLVGFAVFYAIQRRTGTDQPGTQAAPMASDPEGRPVQKIAPPRGESERDLKPRVLSTNNSNASKDVKGEESAETKEENETGAPILPDITGPIILNPTQKPKPEGGEAEEGEKKEANQTTTPAPKKGEEKGRTTEETKTPKAVVVDEPPPVPTTAPRKRPNETPKLPQPKVQPPSGAGE